MTNQIDSSGLAHLAALLQQHGGGATSATTLAASNGEPRPADLLVEQLGGDTARLPVVTTVFPNWERPNVHLGIQACVSRDGRSFSLTGIADVQAETQVTLAALAGAAGRRFVTSAVQYESVQVAGGSDLSCVAHGLYLVTGRELAVALLVAPCRFGMLEMGVRVELMAPTPEQAEYILREIRREALAHNIYRGQTLSITPNACGQGIEVDFLSLPSIARDEIILPEDLLARIERPTVRFGVHVEKLRRAGRHLKRGVLLYGPPGAGKTLTAMHLAGRMTGRTVFVLTGQGLGLVQATCQMARALSPSTIILEDVDLVAEQRAHPRLNPVLFELLNAMDGIAEDADILFLLTTNRPEILEPALSARPGRVDQAIEVPLPDADCRRRLLDLYAQGLTIKCRKLDQVIKRTEGVTASFIRELLRRAALIAAEEQCEDQRSEIVIDDGHMQAAIDELTSAGAIGLGMIGAGGTVAR